MLSTEKILPPLHHFHIVKMCVVGISLRLTLLMLIDSALQLRVAAVRGHWDFTFLITTQTAARSLLKHSFSLLGFSTGSDLVLALTFQKAS